MLKKGKIYKLYLDGNNCYIGSTVRDIRKRIAEHKYDIKNGRVAKIRCDFFKDNLNEMKYSILEELETDNHKEVLNRERYWIENLKPNINNNIPIREKGEYFKLWYAKNQDKVKVQRREKITCEKCGIQVCRSNIARHQKSARCKNKDQLKII